jgi:hypothetical protein
MIRGPAVRPVRHEKRSYGPKSTSRKVHPPHQKKLINLSQSDNGSFGFTHTLYTPGKPSKYRVGDKTGAVRAPEPPVFRRFGSNTRERCYPLPDTGILDNVYTWPPVRSHDPPCQLVAGSVPFQAGNPKVNEKVPLLRRSSTVWNCVGKTGR